MRRLLALVLLAPAALPATASAAAPGTFAGSLGTAVPKGAQADVRAVDRASGTVVAADQADRKGRFTLKLPAGSYTVVGTVTPTRRGATPVTVVSAVSLTPGQKRTKADLKRKRKKKQRARAAYVQELGQVTPGVIAVEIPDITGELTGDFGAVRRGINDLAVTDLVGDRPPDCGIAVLEVDRRADVLKELEFQQSPYVDPASRVKRNFILGDVEVRGRATQVDGTHIKVTYELRDTRTGERLGGVSGQAGGDTFFADLERLSSQLGDELCKLSDSYDVTLDVRGEGNFATHAASGVLQAKLVATRANRKDTTWTATGTLAWTPPAVVPKLPCAFVAPVAPTVPWTVTLKVSGENQLKITWGVQGNDMSTSTIDCPADGQGADPPPVPGMPGTSLLNTGPLEFTLPFSGGQQAVSGSVAEGSEGFFDTGTMTVKPGRIVRVGP